MFELIFEGPVDESADTIRELKGVFISDLEMTVDQVREILAHAPIAIKQSSDRSELEKNQGALEKAGGKVLIVQPDYGEDDDEDIPTEEMTFEFELDGGTLINGTDKLISAPPPEPISAEPPPSEDEISSLLAQLDNQTILEKPAPPPIVEQLIREAVKQNQTKGPEVNNIEPATPSLPEPAPALSLAIEPTKASTPPGPQPTSAELTNATKATPEVLSPEPKNAQPIAPISDAQEEDAQPSTPPLPQRLKPKLGKLGQNFAKDKNEVSAANQGKVASEPTIEQREQVLSVEILLPRSKKRFSFPVETVLSVLMAVLVLAGGNWVIMSRQQKINTSAALDHYMMRLANPETPTEPQPAANPKVAPPAPTDQQLISGRNDADERDIISRFMVDNQSVVSMTVHIISRGHPTELTPEQLVHHDQAPLWVNRVDADDFDVTQLTGGRFIARGKAKVFVEQDKNRRRIAAKATVTGTYDQSAQKISATIRLDRGTFETFPGSSAIERSGDGTERLTLSAPITAEEVEQNPNLPPAQ